MIKKPLSVSAIAILGLSMGATVYFNTFTSNNSYASSSKVKSIKDVSVVSNTLPTNPQSEGHVSQEFIDRFNNAISLNADGTKFVINESLIPTNATQTELTELNNLVNQSNKDLAPAVQSAPSQNVEKVGNSVVVANDSQTAEKVSAELQGQSLTNVSRYHEGSTYIHHYWWGYRIGISKTDLHRAAFGLNAAALFPYDKWIPLGWVVSVVAGLAGLSAGSAPGGVVFNYSGVPATPYGTIWSVGFQ